MKIYKEHLVFAAGILVSLAIGSWLGQAMDEGGKATVDGKRPIPILIGNQTIDSQRQKLIPESPKTAPSPDLPKTPKGVPDTQNGETDPQKPLTVPKQDKQTKQGKQTKQVNSKQKESNHEQQQEEKSTRPR